MILFLTENATLGIQICEKLLGLGVIIRWAKPDAGVCLCRDKDTCGVILDGTDDPIFAESICSELLESYPDLPIALLIPACRLISANVTRIIRTPMDGASVIRELMQFLTDSCGWSPILSNYALTVGQKPEQTVYLGYPLPISPTGLMILRFLFFRAPATVSTSELLAVCYPRNTQLPANIKVQIGKINQSAIKHTGVPLIEYAHGKGYRLCGGIVAPAGSRDICSTGTAKTMALR